MNLRSIMRYFHLNLALFLNLPFYHFGKHTHATKEKYLEIFNTAKNKKYPKVEEFLSKYNDKIEEDWINELALHTQVVIKPNPINFQHGKIIYSILMRHLKENQQKKITILETGTARGFSSMVMAKALADTNTEGTIHTIDICPHDFKMMWNCIDDHEGMKTRAEILKPWEKYLSKINFIHGKSKNILKNLSLEKVNFAFLDAEHKLKDLKIEFEYVHKRQKKGDIIFFDDYTPKLFDEVVNFVDNIEKNYQYKVEKIQSSNLRGYAIATREED